MFPWEHVAFAYVLYSFFAHARFRRAPEGAPVFVAAFASVLPDLVDKPLAWTFHLTPGGITVAHSLLVGVPAAVTLGVLLWGAGRAAVGAAFAIGYVSHIVGDMLFHLVTDDYVLAPFLWPVVVIRDSGGGESLFSQFFFYMGLYVEGIMSGEYFGYVVFQVLMLLFVFGLWLWDGRPGLAEIRRAIA